MKTDTIQNTAEMPLKGGRKLNFSRTLIMGVLNVTPDSFSDSGHFAKLDNALAHAEKMIADGADIIDIGGESSRPGSEPITAVTEKERVIPVIKEIRKSSDIPISIDTTKAEIAREALEAGADIINDISAMRKDDDMINIALNHNAPVILMHMLGEPKTMQKEPHYDDCVEEIKQFFWERIDFCIEKGFDRSRIIIDPGIGFGKRLQDNLAILNNLHDFISLGCPVLIGASRKSFIGMITENNDSADKRIGGSLAAVHCAVTAGCQLVRVHDVAETVEALKVLKAIKGAD